MKGPVDVMYRYCHSFVVDLMLMPPLFIFFVMCSYK